MGNNQLQQFSEYRQKVPALVKIISLLMLLSGIGSLFVLVAFFSIGFLGGRPGSFTDLFFSAAGLALVEGVALGVVSFGIRRMRRWGLYAFTLLTVWRLLAWGYLLVASREIDFTTMIVDVIQVLFLIYLWKISKRFITQPLQPFLHRWLPIIAGVVIVVLVGAGFLAGNFLGKSESEPEIKTEEIAPAGFPEVGDRVIEDETANWKTYRNAKYRYELKYPSDQICGGGELGVPKEEQFSCYFDIVKGEGIDLLITHNVANINGNIKFVGSNNISLVLTPANALETISKKLQEDGYTLLPATSLDRVTAIRLLKESKYDARKTDGSTFTSHQYHEVWYFLNNDILFTINFSFLASSDVVDALKSQLPEFEKIVRTIRFFLF